MAKWDIYIKSTWRTIFKFEIQFIFPRKRTIENIFDQADIDTGKILYEQISEKYTRKFF